MLLDHRFLEDYMPQASGEFVKVYIEVLRHAGDGEVTVAQIADRLNHTETDVLRAVRYWEKAGLFLAGWNPDGTLRTLQVSDFPENGPEEAAAEETAPVTAPGKAAGAAGPAEAAGAAGTAGTSGYFGGAGSAGTAGAVGTSDPAEAAGFAGSAGAAGTSEPAGSAGEGVRPAARAQTRRTTVFDVQNDKAFEQLLFLAQTYFRKAELSTTDVNTFLYLYGDLKMSPDLLEYLMEQCVETGHTSVRYMEKVALNWTRDGIRSVADAKVRGGLWPAEYYETMRAFGITDRAPVNGEREFLNRWYKEWAFSKDVVLEACARTMRKFHKPNFAYADRILQRWHDEGLDTLQKIGEDDRSPKAEERIRQARETAGASGGSGAGNAAASGRGVKNRFRNFDERTEDLDREMMERMRRQHEDWASRTGRPDGGTAPASGDGR